MDNKAGAQFRLEPCSLWRHYGSGVGNVHQLLHAYRVESQSHGHLTAVNAPFQLFKSAYSAYEVNSLVGAEVGDAEDVTEYQVT